MDKKLAEHKKFMEEKLNSIENHKQLKNLTKYHQRMTQHFQAERAIHLIITLFFALFSIILAVTSVVTANLAFLVLTILVLVLLIPYVFHYYKLENGVHSLYQIDKELLNLQGSKNED